MAATALLTSSRKKLFACSLYFDQTLVLASKVTADEQAAADERVTFSDGAASAPVAKRTAAISAFIFAVTLVMIDRVGVSVMRRRTKTCRGGDPSLLIPFYEA